MKKIVSKGIIVNTFHKNENDYISLTDIARYKNPKTTGLVISHWLSTRFAVEFMGVWEQIHNSNFNVTEFRNIKNESGSNGYVLTSKQWINKTGAIGLISKAGRYGSGTFAHQDIAFEFATWISPEFKLYLIKEFQRLKLEENQRLSLGWDVKRQLTKINYRIHTDSIKHNLVPNNLSIKQTQIIYASEADVLNVAIFGMTAKDWKDKNKGKEGNIRDYCDVTQLVVLANLESINSNLIEQQIPQSERLIQLNIIAISQMRSLANNISIKKLEDKL